MPRLDRDGDVCLLHLGDDENRFHPDWVAALDRLLDDVPTEPPAALVSHATGKFWSNGLDLDWLESHPGEAAAYAESVHALLGQFLTLPVPTVAAVQGHAFAAGAILALAHDWRVMRGDRGFFCLPEVAIRIPFTVGLDALIRAKLPIPAAFEAMTTGRRYGGWDAAEAGIVTQAVAAEDVLDAAIERARSLATTAGPTLGTMKARMFAAVTDALAVPFTTAH